MREGSASALRKARVRGSSASGMSIVGWLKWRVDVQPPARVAHSSDSAMMASHSSGVRSGSADVCTRC